MICWTSSKMDTSDWSKFVCYAYLAATTTLFKNKRKTIYISVRFSCPILLSLGRCVHYLRCHNSTVFTAAAAVQFPEISAGSSDVNGTASPGPWCSPAPPVCQVPACALAVISVNIQSVQSQN